MIRTSLVVLALASGLLGGCGESATTSPATPPATTTPAATAAGVCKHNVMDADCFYCHPELKEKLGFCKEHGVSEAECWICKPSMAAAYKAQGDWCAEHSTPESKCKQCGK